MRIAPLSVHDQLLARRRGYCLLCTCQRKFMARTIRVDECAASVVGRIFRQTSWTSMLPTVAFSLLFAPRLRGTIPAQSQEARKPALTSKPIVHLPKHSAAGNAGLTRLNGTFAGKIFCPGDECLIRTVGKTAFLHEERRRHMLFNKRPAQIIVIPQNMRNLYRGIYSFSRCRARNRTLCCYIRDHTAASVIKHQPDCYCGRSREFQHFAL